MARLDTDWLLQLEESVPAFLKTLRVGFQSGRYLPCKRGPTEAGREMSLGWSCFALKLMKMLGRWDDMERDEREHWVEFIQDFQRTDGDGLFEDPAQLADLRRPLPLKSRLFTLVGRGPKPKDPEAARLAETKQAIATLAEVGAEPRRPFRGFPKRADKLREWFDARDWSQPWGAGGQSAGMVVFVKTQAPQIMDNREANVLLAECRDFYADLADEKTGAYFRGKQPAHGELVNGAMKVLMALDWLDVRPHFADALIETVLAQPPKADGCHLVDAVYVLHQCLAGRPAPEAVRDYALRVADLIRAHANADGGFSFFVRKAQTDYYGATVSRGLDESDVQGTCLLVWALAMIWRMVEPGTARWRTMRP